MHAQSFKHHPRATTQRQLSDSVLELCSRRLATRNGHIGVIRDYVVCRSPVRSKLLSVGVDDTL